MEFVINMDKIIPNYLYHYTNIESLALILKNKTIRFNSLDRVDDLQEQETKDVKNAGQFIYVSSWTNDKTESIAMWNLYGSLDSGIRIKLKTFPFKTYEYSKEDVLRYNMRLTGDKISLIIPLEEIFSKKFYCANSFGNDVLFSVNYTDDKDKLYPHIFTREGEKIFLAFGELGKYKNKYWEFQKEWRYVLPIFPMDLGLPPQEAEQKFIITANKIAKGIEKQPFPYYELKIDEEAFKGMEILLSPKFTDGNKVIVKSLLDKYNKFATIRDSDLKGLI